MTLLEALRDPNLFAPFFKGESWRPWFSFLAALFAEKPRGSDLETYRALTGRTTWPRKPFREAVLIVGRRGGKSRILALLAVYYACFLPYAHLLAPGQKARIAVLAKDREQAGEIFAYALGLIEATPLLAPMVARRDSETIELSNRVVIAIGTASFRSIRGYTLAACLCDELAFWFDDAVSANPAAEVLRAVRPGLATIPGAPLIIASSPYAKKGELYGSHRRYYGRNDAEVLVWKASSRTMNASLDEAFITAEYEKDPESARAEYGAEFRQDLVDYIAQEALDDVVMQGNAVSCLPPRASSISPSSTRRAARATRWRWRSAIATATYAYWTRSWKCGRRPIPTRRWRSASRCSGATASSR
jgi:hypothetical protein